MILVDNFVQSKLRFFKGFKTMAKFIKITNAGIAHIESFTLLGVSTARGEASKIGQFGSGAKMGILTCLRKGLHPIVVSGNNRIEFGTIDKHMGNKPYKQVIAIVNGVTSELGFSLEFGALDWTKVDYAIREFVSNAKDQGNCDISIVDTIDASSDNSTSLYVEYTDDIKTYHQNIGKYFIDCDDIIQHNYLSSFKVYRKNVLVCENTDKRSLFMYNLADLKVDESRNAEMYQVLYSATWSLKHMDDNQAETLVKALINGVDCIEVNDFQACYYNFAYTNAKLLAAYNRKYNGLKIVSQELAQFASNKQQCIVVSAKAFEILSNAGVEQADIMGSRKGAENGFVSIAITTDCKRIFNRVWKKVVALGFHNGKAKPELAMFSKPMSNGSTIGGYYENGTVYIDRNHVTPKVILEEIGHYVTDADDCTRDFQDWAFSIAGALL